jgi:hypothetical protein
MLQYNENDAAVQILGDAENCDVFCVKVSHTIPSSDTFVLLLIAILFGEPNLRIDLMLKYALNRQYFSINK